MKKKKSTNETLGRCETVVIGGPKDIDYAALGASRIDCTPKSIIRFSMPPGLKHLVYWPDTPDCKKSIPAKQRSKIFAEANLNQAYWSRADFTEHGLRRQDSPERIAEGDRRYTCESLARIVTLAGSASLTCVVVVKKHIALDRENCSWTLGWISERLRINEGSRSGIHTTSGVDAPESVKRLIERLPLDSRKWTLRFELEPSRGRWGDLMIFRDAAGGEIFNELTVTGNPFTLFVPHQNDRAQWMSLFFRINNSGGGILVIPPVISLDDLLKEIAALSTHNSPPPAPNGQSTNGLTIRLTLRHQPSPGNKSNMRRIVKWGEEEAGLPEVAFLRLLAFYVAALHKNAGYIKVDAPKINGSDITAVFGKISNGSKAAQTVNEPMKEWCEAHGNLIGPQDGKSHYHYYRLKIAPEQIDVSELENCRDEKIRRLLDLRPR